MPKINKTSKEVRNAILRKSAYSLPDNPSNLGYKPKEIRERLYKPITDESNSMQSELDRIVDELNENAIFNDSVGNEGGNIVKRDEDGNITLPETDSEKDNTALSRKRAKEIFVEKESGSKKIYATNVLGKYKALDYGPSRKASCIVQRDDCGNVIVPDEPFDYVRDENGDILYECGEGGNLKYDEDGKLVPATTFNPQAAINTNFADTRYGRKIVAEYNNQNGSLEICLQNDEDNDEENDKKETISECAVHLPLVKTTSTPDMLYGTDSNGEQKEYPVSRFAEKIDLSYSDEDGNLTVTLKNEDGETLSSDTVNIPVESTVVSIDEYEVDGTVYLKLMLRNGNYVEVALDDVVKGLAKQSSLDELKTKVDSVSIELDELEEKIASEWDFVIDSYYRLGEISSMYGNVLIQFELPEDMWGGRIIVPKSVKYLKIDISRNPNTSTDTVLDTVIGHEECVLDGCYIGYSSEVSGFKEVRNVDAVNGTIKDCIFIHNCSAQFFTDCNYIENSSLVTTREETSIISKCKHICHIECCSIFEDAPISITDCDIVENISASHGFYDVVYCLTITNAKTVDTVSGFISVNYTDCKYVNPHTCQDYVSQQGAVGLVQVLTEDGSFEAASLGSGVDEDIGQRVTDLEDAIYGVEEELQMINNGGIE